MKTVQLKIKFQTQFDARFGDKKKQNVSCKKACEIIVQSAGFATPTSNAGSINVATMDKNKKLVLSSTAQAGYDLLNAQLDAGKPTCVAVDREYTGDVGNANNASDHFVVIYGRYEKDGVIYYLFADPGTSYESKGMSAENLMYKDANGFLKGHSKYYGSAKFYTTTEVRPTK